MDSSCSRYTTCPRLLSRNETQLLSRHETSVVALSLKGKVEWGIKTSYEKKKRSRSSRDKDFFLTQLRLGCRFVRFYSPLFRQCCWGQHLTLHRFSVFAVSNSLFSLPTWLFLSLSPCLLPQIQHRVDSLHLSLQQKEPGVGDFCGHLKLRRFSRSSGSMSKPGILQGQQKRSCQPSPTTIPLIGCTGHHIAVPSEMPSWLTRALPQLSTDLDTFWRCLSASHKEINSLLFS